MKNVTLVMIVAVTLAGCATRFDGPLGSTPSASPAMLDDVAGHWSGTVWETGTWYVQGRKALDLHISEAGTWRGTVAGQPASGVVRQRGGHVVLEGTARDQDGSTTRVYYRLASDDARLWGETVTTFGGRPGRASVSLERVS
jgi:hypothetical protein